MSRKTKVGEGPGVQEGGPPSRRDVLKGAVGAAAALAAASLLGKATRSMVEGQVALASAGIKLFASGKITASSTTRVFNVASATGLADTLAVAVQTNQTGVTATSVTDSKGNVYTKKQNYNAATPTQQVFVCPGANGGAGGTKTAALTTSDTVTVTMSSSSSAVVVLEALDLPGVGALDQVTGPTHTSSVTSASTTITPGQDDETLVAMCSVGAASTVPAFASPATDLGAAGASPYVDSGYQALSGGKGVPTTLTTQWSGATSPCISGLSFAPIPPLYFVNYEGPINYGGPNMWINYGSIKSIIASDLSVIAAFGFNGIRCFLQETSGAFNFPSPTSTELANLKDFYTKVQAAGLQMHVTLTGLNGGNWGHINDTYTWIEAVVGALQAQDPSLSAVRVWETHNEIWAGANKGVNYQGTGKGYDSGWPSNLVQYEATADSWDVALVWHSLMTDKLRALAPGIPVTASVPSGQGTPSGGLGFFVTGVNSGDSNLEGFKCSAPDWYDYHLYGAQSAIQSLLTTAQSVCSPAPLHVGETGYNYDGDTDLTTAQQQTQANFVQDARYWCDQLGIPEPYPWQLYDLEPASFQFTSGQLDGLKDDTGADKLLGTLYRNYPPGTVPPKI